jgi:hypothetical protein
MTYEDGDWIMFGPDGEYAMKQRPTREEHKASDVWELEWARRQFIASWRATFGSAFVTATDLCQLPHQRSPVATGLFVRALVGRSGIKRATKAGRYGYILP